MKCKVCGSESGKYPLCRACNLKKHNGEIIKCSVCNNWHYAATPCSVIQVTGNETPYLYEFRRSLISKSEQDYYDAIQNALPEEFCVFPQINLATFIYRTDNARFHNELFRNVDFLITDGTYTPKIVVEINDQTHYSNERKERDEKVQKICEEAGIPIIRLWTSYGVNVEYIKRKIHEILNASSVVRIHHFSEAPTPITEAPTPIIEVPTPITEYVRPKDEDTAYPRSKKKVAIVLCLLGLLGFAGLHRLYVGKAGSGMIYLLTLGLYFVGTLVDLFAIITGRFTDKNGQPLE